MADGNGASIERTSAPLPAVSGEVRINGFGEVWRMAEALAEARGFVPDAYVGKPAAIAACVLTGIEVGIGPMESLRAIHIVKGKPMLDASLLAKLAIRAGVTIDYVISTDTECVVRLGRAGRVHSEGFSLKDAERAGLTANTRSGEPSMYAKYPRRMLQARALSTAIRAWCPDVVGASVYVEGEIVDVADAVPHEQPREVVATVVTREQTAAKRPAKDAALKTALRDELPACQHADAMRAWADTHAERLTGLANGARATAQQLVLEQCDRVCATADGEVVAEHAQQLAAEVLQLAGLS